MLGYTLCPIGLGGDGEYACVYEIILVDDKLYVRQGAHLTIDSGGDGEHACVYKS